MKLQWLCLLSVATLAGAGANGAFAQQRCDRPAELRGALSETGPLAEELGRTATSCGADWTAANLLERSNALRSPPSARFNLATAYQNSGRYDAALDLYRTLLTDGQFTRVTLDPQYERPADSLQSVNIADEAKRRIADIQFDVAMRKAAGAPSAAAATDAALNASSVGSQTARSAEDAAVNAAAVTSATEPQSPIAATVAANHVVDAVAFERDGL